MKKTESTQTTKTTQYVYCDKCDTHIGHGSILNSRYVCEICERDLCRTCVEDLRWDGDYTVAHCKSCWDIKQLYSIKVEKLEREISKLWNECEIECINKIKKL